MIGYVQRPVKKGEQLFIDYFWGKDASIGQKNLDFECKCTKCVPCWKEEDRKRIQMDPDFSFVLANAQHKDVRNHQERSVLKAKLESLMSKYGRLPWSPEFRAIEFHYRNGCAAESYSEAYCFSTQRKSPIDQVCTLLQRTMEPQ